MDQYVGLDVSLKETHFCVVDGTGAVLARVREVAHPELLARALTRHAPAGAGGGSGDWRAVKLAATGA